MIIKANDTVRVGDDVGKVVKVYEHIAIVEFDDDILEKVPLEIIEKVKVEQVKQEPTINRAQFREGAKRIMDPELYVVDGEKLTPAHAAIALAAALACTKLEKILFGSES